MGPPADGPRAHYGALFVLGFVGAAEIADLLELVGLLLLPLWLALVGLALLRQRE
jgi:hypothetical protein